MLRILGVVLLLLGLGFLSSGVREWRSVRGYLAGTLRLEGTVVHVEEARGPRPLHYTVAEVRAPDGTRPQVRARRGSNPPRHRVGEPIAVLYDPALPGRSRLAAERAGVWRPVRAKVGLGAAFLLVGAILVWLPRSRAGYRPGRWRGGRGVGPGTFRHTH